MVDDHSRIFQIPTTCDVTSGTVPRKLIGATRAGSYALHVLPIQRCIDGLNGGQGGRAELTTTHG